MFASKELRRSRALFCCWLLASLPAAQAVGESLTIRGRGVWTDESDDLGRTGGLVVSTVTIDGADGLALAAEWRPVPFWGLELSVTELAFDAEFRQRVIRPPELPQVPEIFDQGELVVRPVSLALLMHPLRGGRGDLYFGPAVSHVSYDVDVGSELERADEWGYGVVLGLEVPIGEAGWAAGFEGRYLTAEHDDVIHGLWGRFSTYWLGAGVSFRVDGR